MSDLSEPPFRNAAISTLVHATEDEQRVITALQTLLPVGVKISRSKLKGHYGNPIMSFEARVERGNLLREIWSNLMAKLRTGELEKLKEIARERIDDDCRLYLRFDKQLAHSGELALTESGDAIHLKLKVVAYPAKREVAIGIVERWWRNRDHEEIQT